MLFERLVTGKVDRMQILPAGVGVHTPEGMQCLQSWLNGVQSMLSERLCETYSWQDNAVRAALPPLDSNAPTYDVLQHLQQYLPTGFACVHTLDGVWAVSVDDWTPVTLCAAQMVYWQTRAMRPEWSALVDQLRACDVETRAKVKSSVPLSMLDTLLSDLCWYMAYRLPPRLGWYATMKAVREEVYGHGGSYFVHSRVGIALEQIFRDWTRSAVWRVAQRSVKNVRFSIQSCTKELYEGAHKRHSPWSLLNQLERGNEFDMRIPGRHGEVDKVRVMYVVPDELAGNDVCGCDLAIRRGDDFTEDPVEFNYAVRITGQRNDTTLVGEVVASYGGLAVPCEVCLTKVG